MTDRPAQPSSHPLTAAGIVFVLLGMGTTAYALFSSGAVGYSQTLNLGLLNDKLILAVAGSALFLGGLFLAVMGAVLNHLAQVSRIGHGAPASPAPIAEASAPESVPQREIMPAPPAPAPAPDQPLGADVRPGGGGRGRHWRQHQ